MCAFSSRMSRFFPIFYIDEQGNKIVINSIYRDSLTPRSMEVELLSCVISFEISSNRCASFERNNVSTHFRGYIFAALLLSAELTCLTSRVYVKPFQNCSVLKSSD